MKALTRCCCLWFVLGCVQEESSILDFDYDGDEKSDIGGVEALGASLNAIGTVGSMWDGKYQYFCSATLIGPSTVLTAKHCGMDFYGLGMKLVNTMPVYFAVGPDANNPVRTVEAVAGDLSPVDGGGFVGLGNDISILHLVEPITDITPIKVAPMPLTDADLGKKFLGVGYGSKDVFEDLTGSVEAHRRMGTKTLHARTGKAFELMLGSFDAFLESLAPLYGWDLLNEFKAEVQQMYDETKILDDYEVWAGFAMGDSQTCHGDSGGPLVGRVRGEDGTEQKYVFGVVSGGWFSRDLTCDYGTYYAVIGPRTRQLIDQALQWTDPCAGGLTAMGQCEGTEAVRCTGKWEGNRRVTRVDCAGLDLTCGQDAAGQVACVDPAPAPAPPHEDPADGRTTPTLMEVRNEVVRNTTHGMLHRAMQLLEARRNQ